MTRRSVDKFSPIIKDRVKALLKDQGRTQKEVAQSLDITPEHLNRCLNNGKITKTWLYALAKELGVPRGYLSGISDCKSTWEEYDEAEQLQTIHEDIALIRYINSLGYDPFSTDEETLADLTDEVKRFIKFRCEEVLQKKVGLDPNNSRSKDE